MCIVIVCFRGFDVINFEINLTLITLIIQAVFLPIQKFKTEINIVSDEIKSIFHQELVVAKNCFRTDIA